MFKVGKNSGNELSGWLVGINLHFLFSPVQPPRLNIVTLLTTIINPPTFEPASLIMILVVHPNNQTLHK